MPIRLRDATSFVARLRATTGDATSSVAGTHVGPPGVSGSLVTRLGDVVSEMSASFQPAANRFGTIATTLQGAASTEFGTSAPPLIPDKIGAVATTLAGVSCSIRGNVLQPQQQYVLWANWPWMNVAAHQGNSAGTLLDFSTHPMIADKDLMMVQESYPTVPRMQARIDAFENVWAQQVGSPMHTQFMPHVIPSVADKNFPAVPGQGGEEITKELIDSPTDGNERWYMHITGNQTPAGRVEDFFNPGGTWAVNIGHKLSDVNSLGETFAVAFYKKWDSKLHIGAVDIRPYWTGMFQDVTTVRPVVVKQNNGSIDVTNNVDFNYDGVAEVRGSFNGSSTAGGSQYAAGQMRLKAALEARFAAYGWWMMPNAAEWDLNFSDGSGAPDLPLSNHPCYRGWEVTFDEVANNSLGLRRDLTTPTGYRYSGGGSPATLFLGWATQEKMIKLDANIPAKIGHGAVVGQSSMNDRVPTQDDIAFARTMSLVCMLTERIAASVQAPQRVFSLDETLVELGNPVAPRTMGAFNETTRTFQQRTPDRTVVVGAVTATFHWSVFQKGIIVFRSDNPTVGTWPSGDAAVSCTLPSAGAGFKWQRLGPVYQNPITKRTTRNQTPTLNNGADVTSVLLKPYEAVLIRKVAS